MHCDESVVGCLLEVAQERRDDNGLNVMLIAVAIAVACCVDGYSNMATSLLICFS
jgi:hypothetical protein